MSKSVSIFEAKSKLSAVLRLVKAGQEVTINERGQPIAKIIPFPGESLTLAERLSELERQGRVIRATHPENVREASPDKIKPISGALKAFLESR